MPNPTAAMLVIGDEILSGRTRDANTHHLATALTERGIDLCEVRVVADDPDAITGAIRTLSARFDHLFTSGGIGPTHDDITADAVACAFGKTIDVREEARARLVAHYAPQEIELNAARLRMARIPAEARLIDNPVSAAPGFSLENCHVMAGVPAIFQAMLAGLLPEISGGAPLWSESRRFMIGEGDIAAPLGALAEDNPELSIGSYPFQKDGRYGTRIVIRSPDATAAKTAMQRLTSQFPGASE